MKSEEYIKNLIDGELVPPTSGLYFDNYNPSTGKVYSQIPDSDDQDVQLAVEAAERAFPEWSKTDVDTRFRILTKLSDIIEQNLDAFAMAESVDSGKPIRTSTTIDIPRAHQNIRFFATAILHFASESHKMSGAINFTLRQPIGIVGCISPWNLPLYLFTWKIAPALAAGNCVIAKPSEVTPMTAFLLSKACEEAGLPKGVLNVIHGYGPKAGQAIVAHPKIKAISFTGGTNTGKHIIKTAGPMFKKLSLELGGKNPNLIFADCDFDKMIKGTIRSSFTNNGQVCLCGSRIYVERPIYEKFKEAFLQKTRKLSVGHPLSKETRQGAMVSKDHMEKVLGYIELAKEEGGTILHGGNQIKLDGELAEGYYLQPTIIEGLPQNCRTNQEEIFGPVVTLTPFDTEEEVVAYANGTVYGLSSTIWTQDINRANRIAEQLQAGIVWINCWLMRDLRTPFGGVKNSGVGREGGLEALRFFTETKNVCIRY